jgi:hypothetical protein
MRSSQILTPVFLVAAFGAERDFSDHSDNAVFQDVVSEGLAFGGVSIKLPDPTFTDDQSSDDQREALTSLAGSARRAAEMLRDSVTAPHLLRLHDKPAEGGTLRSGDAYFVVHADLDRLDPDEIFGRPSKAAVEAGNMRFEAHVLSADELKSGPVDSSQAHEWFVHTKGRLLDRIVVESTARIMSSRSNEFVVIASRTDHRFDKDDRWPNRWITVKQKGNADVPGPSHPFAGGIGYTKITRLKSVPTALLVESHFAFAEPGEWFDGAPILRSKLGLITEDQVRRLRREIAKATRK